MSRSCRFTGVHAIFRCKDENIADLQSTEVSWEIFTGDGGEVHGQFFMGPVKKAHMRDLSRVDRVSVPQATADSFPVGATVELHSLTPCQGCQASNGERGEVEGFRQNKGKTQWSDCRVLVKLPQGVKAFRPRNVRVPLAPGLARKLRKQVRKVLRGLVLENTSLGQFRAMLEKKLGFGHGALDEHRHYIGKLLQAQLGEVMYREHEVPTKVEKIRLEFTNGDWCDIVFEDITQADKAWPEQRELRELTRLNSSMKSAKRTQGQTTSSGAGTRVAATTQVASGVKAVAEKVAEEKRMELARVAEEASIAAEETARAEEKRLAQEAEEAIKARAVEADRIAEEAARTEIVEAAGADRIGRIARAAAEDAGVVRLSDSNSLKLIGEPRDIEVAELRRELKRCRAMLAESDMKRARTQLIYERIHDADLALVHSLHEILTNRARSVNKV